MSSAGSAPDESVRPRVRPVADEGELVRRAQLGSVAAFEQLVIEFGPAVHRYLALRLRDDGDARDALQETLTAAWQGLPRLQQPAKFRSWVLGIATHKAVDARRGRVRTSDADVELQGREDESAGEIRQAILTLPASFRDVLLLRYVLQLSEDEVAEALGVRRGTVKSRTSRARKALGERLR